MSTTLITSRDPEGLQFTGLCEAVYDKARLDESRAQRLNENGSEFTTGLKKLVEQLSISNRYAGEEITSSCTYPNEYKGPKPISQQIDALAKIFGLSLGYTSGYTSEFVEKVLSTLALPDGAEGWFAIPSIDALASRFFPKVKDPEKRSCRAANLILAKIEKSRKFYSYSYDRQLTPDRFRLSARTAHMLDLLAGQQKGDIQIVGGSFGKRHAGRSVRRMKEVFVGPEFGGHTVAVGSMLLTHPERLVSYDDLWVDAPGDEFDPGAHDSFDCAPCFSVHDSRVKFDSHWGGRPDGHCGSVSLFLPQ